MKVAKLGISLLWAASMMAQVDTGVLTGHVYDNSQSIIVGARITVTNVGTNYRLELQTSAEGIYVSPPLPAGKYRIEAGASGFRNSIKEVQLNVADRLGIDFQLEVGSLTESITVEQLATVLETETVTLGTQRTVQEVQDLPNNGRNFSEIMRYTAGVTPAMSQRATLPLSQIKGDTSHTVNGAPMGDNNFLVDGIQNNSTHQGYGVFVLPELEAIDQYRVETSVPDARFGRTGATLNVGYKSGTNRFHGTLFEFLRNDALDARNFFATGPKPALRRNMLGGTLGGPIGGKDAHTFFFVSYEGQRMRQEVTTTANVPTAQMRDGDFSQLSATVLNPYTQRPNPAGTGYVRDPFPGNKIDKSLWDKSGAAVLAFFPVPTQSGLVGNLRFAPPNRGNNDQGTVKIDHDFSSGSRGFIRYTEGYADFVNAFQSTLGPAATPYPNVRDPVYQVVISHTQILSPRTIHQARFGFSREGIRTINLNGGRNTAQEFGIQNVNVDKYTTGLSNISVNGLAQIGDSQQNPATIAMNNFQFGDNVDTNRGKHSFKFGFDVVRRQTNVFQAVTPRGLFNFSGNYTNNGTADLLLGKPQTVSLVSLDGTRGLRRTDWDVWAQDDWKLSGRLTLNLGLRYDLLAGYPNYEVGNRMSQFDVTTGTWAPVGKGKFPDRNGVGNDYNNLGPRFGLAYRLTGKTALRAGYGIFYYMRAIAQQQALSANAPWVINTLVTNDQNNFANARPLSAGPLRTSDPYAPGQNRIGFSQPFPIAYTQQWNVALQRQLPFTQILTVAYVGSKGTHLDQSVNLNQPVVGTGNVDARRRWPNNAAVNMFTMRGNYTYNSLQATLVKRLSKGLNAQVAYTWSHNIGDPGFNEGDGAAVPQYALWLNKGSSDNDVRHSFRATYTYQLPVGRGKRFFSGMNRIANTAFGGWETTSGLSLWRGLPFSVIAGTNTLNIGASTRANRLRNGTLPADQRTILRWFDYTAFTDPGFQQWGNGGRNILVGPPTRQLDCSLFKNFNFNEIRRLQFRAEAYNISNTPQFNNPISNLGAARVGQITGAGSEASLQRAQRQIQFALKFYF